MVTDSGWKTATGPILGSDLYDGEDYDARLEMPGWNTPGFDDGAWEAARESGEVAETPRLVQKSSPPVRYMRELKPVRLLRPKKDVCIWDFGQNFSGTFRVHPRGIPGRRYTFATAEILEPDGSLYTLNYRGARSQDSYICAGPVEQAAEYVPKFTFHGFRYLQIDGWQFDRVPPEELDVTALVMYSAMPDRCRFSCGDSGVNRLWLNALWGQRSNFLEIPTDCPQRDERLGWTGDAQIFAPAERCGRAIGGAAGANAAAGYRHCADAPQGKRAEQRGRVRRIIGRIVEGSDRFIVIRSRRRRRK